MSEALRRYPWLFAPMHLALIEAGETSGGLDRAAGQVANYVEKDLDVRRKMSRGTLYPKLLLLLAPLILNLDEWVVGSLNSYLSKVGHQIVPLLVAVLAVWLVFKIAVQIPAVAYAFDALKLFVPGIGGVVRKFALAKFARSAALLYDAGAPIGPSIELAADASANAFIATRLKTAVPALRRGVDLHTALSETGALTGTVEDMLAAGQVSGNVDAMLNKVGEYFEAEAEAGMDRTILIVGIGVYLLVALYVGFQIVGKLAGGYVKPIEDILRN